jgi:hypothetical protein
MTEYSHTLEAVAKADAQQWEIGDALIAETGTRAIPKCYDHITMEEWLALPYEEAKDIHLGRPILMSHVANELRKHDIEITAQQLNQYRDTAEAFPPSQRRAGVPWAAHRDAAGIGGRYPPPPISPFSTSTKR